MGIIKHFGEMIRERFAQEEDEVGGEGKDGGVVLNGVFLRRG